MNVRRPHPASLVIPALAALALAITGCPGSDNVTEPEPGPTTGSLQVSASTSGVDIDGDGYRITLIGRGTSDLGINGAQTFASLPAGDYQVELQGVAVNCVVGGQNPRSVTVFAGSTANVAFAVSCAALLGALKVKTATSGDDQDADGYSVTLDGTLSQSVGINGTATFENVRVGDHDVALSGVAPNCSSAGDMKRNLTVSFGETIETTYDVSCSSTTGGVEVMALTSGSDLDPDGYGLMVDGSAGPNLAVNDTVMLGGLSVGDHEIELTGVAANCSVAGGNPRTVTVPSGASAPATFAVSCAALLGDLEVTTSTTGTDIDGDGYTVTVDGTLNQNIGVNGTVTFTNLEARDHQVELTGVAVNCSVVGDNPRTVTITFGSAAATAFDVTCSSLTGGLEVISSTSGTDLDPDGYGLMVDGSAGPNLAVDDTVMLGGLSTGDHEIELTGVAANCSVAGGNPRTVTVPSGASTTTTFSVSCAALLGDLEVTTSTTGLDIDGDGYTVVVDGTLNQNIGVNNTVTFMNLEARDHQVELTGVAVNCSVAGDNPRTVTVPFGSSIATAFDVTCASLNGDLEVTTSTTGSDIDADGYTVTVDGTLNQNIGVTGSVTFANLEARDHQVELLGLAVNCSVVGDNPRTVTVPFGSSITTAFDVTCDPLTGDLEVTTSTTGSDIDGDGYTVTVDGTLNQNIGVNGSVTFTNLDAADHQVELMGLAVNCSVVGNNPRTVTVPFGSAIATAFDVTCDPLTGDLKVITSTLGTDLDPDGYVVTLDGTTQANIGTNDMVTFAGLPAGDHEVDLSGIARNCVVQGENPRTYTVTGINDETTFSLTCFSPLAGKIAFESERDGNWEVYMMNTDGTGKTNLTNDSARDRQPDISPDGLRIAFMSSRDGNNNIHVMGANGSGVVNLTGGGGNNYGPVWSPDGTKLAYTRRSGGVTDVWVINADGTGKTNLTSSASNDEQPSWSPDGTKIAFQSDRDGNFEIYVMNADGSSPVNLTNDPGVDFAPAWSPVVGDSLIMFSADRAGAPGDVYVMNDDGTAQTQMTFAVEPDFEGSWSRDAMRIGFTSRRDGNEEVYVMNRDGSGLIRLTVHAANDGSTSWSP